MSEARFSRTVQLIGEAGLERLQGALVVVAGLGAVGSFATEALARAGVGRLRLVDFDRVQPSNLNRQLLALESTVGRLKCEVARERVLDINPQCRVEALAMRVEAGTVGQALEGQPDLVLDAIDTVTGKMALVMAAQARGIPLMASMGAARRRDPAQVRAGWFSEVTTCPLARHLRRRLREAGFEGDFWCIYSTERAAPLGPASRRVAGEEAVDSRAGLGSLVTLTGLFGLRLAHEALRHLLERGGQGAGGAAPG
ncbi:tRNA threonylcarbamoyladenosine dehydratase [Fontisphaera persica]|uniref:tRNA threonylcarbamoyladenosine dehydratase n=1 Tax=Fontisphaera persica TaxID=2974023 RepID=UPI0024BF84DB|nr:tRNA threonylcarbamoyladenosine dehydratase [Fontisphaera persica]WCJ58003.1 tRNA threonylcarbamoyladenosine dehydratase [Fontisphaera persica]